MDKHGINRNQFRERLNVGTVPTYKMHDVGTVPMFKMHDVGTVPTFKTHHVGSLKKSKSVVNDYPF